MRRRRAAIGHVHHVDAGHHPEQYAGEMGQVSGPARGQVDLAGIGLGIGDELGDGLGRKRRIDHQDESIAVEAGDRGNVARDGDGALLIERYVDGVRGGDKKERIAIGRRTRDRLQREIAAGTRPVVDDHRLAEPLRQRLTDEPRDDVGRAAGGNEDHQCHRPRRISLRPCNTRHGRQRGSARCQMQKLSTGKFHDAPPSSA